MWRAVCSADRFAGNNCTEPADRGPLPHRGKTRWLGYWRHIPGDRSRRRCVYLYWRTGRRPPLPSPPKSPGRCSRESAPPGNPHSESAGQGKSHQNHGSAAREDAEYDAEYTIDLSTLKATVAFPHLPENTKTIDEVGDVAIDQVVIGSCTNGRISDLRIAAQILEGRHVAPGMRCIVIPATQNIYLQAMEEGLLRIFIEAGAVVSTPTCGPCLGGYMGILASGEKCVSTTNRNFVGRMGAIDSEVYLASPAVAAASAVTGRISQPSEL